MSSQPMQSSAQFHDNPFGSVSTTFKSVDGRTLEVTTEQGLDLASGNQLAQRVVVEITGTLPVTIYVNEGQVFDWPGETA